MVKCPECSAEIDYLISREKTAREYCFAVNDEGFGEYEAVTEDSYADDDDYNCPKCNAMLFTNERDATNFLTGKK